VLPLCIVIEPLWGRWYLDEVRARGIVSKDLGLKGSNGIFGGGPM